MQFSEDDLRSALRRKDPGPEFTQRVMDSLHSQESPKMPASRAVSGESWSWHAFFTKTSFAKTLSAKAWFGQAGWRSAMAGAMAIVLMVFAAWIGIERYQSYMQQVQNRKVQEEKVARQAEEQAVRALRITSAKLNHVFQKVNGVPSTEPKVRRQTL